MWCILASLLLAHPAAAADGTVLSRAEYRMPPFERSGFPQRPDVKDFYEHVLRPRFAAMAEKIRVEELVYSSDGLRVKGFFLTPRARGPGPLPLLVFNRGGNRDYGRLTVKDLLWLARFAERGYGVAASQYRGADGGEGSDEFGGRDVDDVRNILRAARASLPVDPRRVFVAGHSRGGMMTYLTLKDSREFAAAAVLAGECDLKKGLESWPDFEKEVYETLIPGYAAHRDASLEERSACAWPGKIHAPLLLLQGDRDDKVLPLQARLMYGKLRALGRPAELRFLPGGGHSVFFEDAHADEVVSRIDAWFRRAAAYSQRTGTSVWK